MTSSAEWSMGRAASRAPYSQSPRSGCPIAAMWTRIWCVRPVRSRTRSSVLRGRPRSIAKSVVAERGASVSVETRSGWGARLSASGYLDCTPWSMFDSEQEANEYLDTEEDP